MSSHSDAALVINGPAGDDDSGEGIDPEITFHRPQSGVHGIRVGAFGGESGNAELFFTEPR